MAVIQGRLVDLHERRIFPAEIEVDSGRIVAIREVESAPNAS